MCFSHRFLYLAALGETCPVGTLPAPFMFCTGDLATERVNEQRPDANGRLYSAFHPGSRRHLACRFTNCATVGASAGGSIHAGN